MTLKRKADTKMVVAACARGLLSHEEFQKLAEVPPEVEWFANIDNARTRRAYQIDVREFMTFVGIRLPDEFWIITRAHAIAWRNDLEKRIVLQKGPEARGLSSASIRRKLSALSSLFEYLCDRNAVNHNPVKGVKRPSVEIYEGKASPVGYFFENLKKRML